VQPTIRAYRPSDLSAVYDVCVRTADGGDDARGMYVDDRLMGDIFAAPYVTLEPEHAHMLDDGTGTAVGYVLGTADTARFVRRYRDEWLPATAGRYPEPADPPVTPTDFMVGLHLNPERMLVPELAGYPAHLHIDLLPEWQGRGFGRGLMEAFLRGVHEAAEGASRHGAEQHQGPRLLSPAGLHRDPGRPPGRPLPGPGHLLAAALTDLGQGLGEDGGAVGLGAPLLDVRQVGLVRLGPGPPGRVLPVQTGRLAAARAVPGLR
jgi:GNAT superfamily N-acetyltransferase